MSFNSQTCDVLTLVEPYGRHHGYDTKVGRRRGKVFLLPLTEERRRRRRRGRGGGGGGEEEGEVQETKVGHILCHQGEIIDV